MKKLMLSLLGAATLAISSNAMALNPGPYQVFLSVGVEPVPVGALLAELEADIPFGTAGSPSPFGACEYVGEWSNGLGPFPLSAECFLVEEKSFANFSCLENSLEGVPTIVAADTVIAPCTGFNYFGQFTQVSSIMLGESFNPPPVPSGPVTPGGAVMEGIIAFCGPLPGPYGLELVN
jgi:hypothetical protein